MTAYNEAFFGGMQNFFIEIYDTEGKEIALQRMAGALGRGLSKAYDTLGFETGSIDDFACVVGIRDETVGLSVEFRKENDCLHYIFHTDPFPNLKKYVTAKEIDATYIPFKIKYLLGDGWKYKTIKHLWNGDSCTEHVIEMKL